jgi:hypothetical protein
VVGASAVSGRVSGGVNYLGADVSVYGEARLGAKVGFEAGAEGVSVHCAVFSRGISLGAAKTAEPEAGWAIFFTRMSPLVEQAAALSSWRGFGPIPISGPAADIFGFLGDLGVSPPSTQVESSTSSDNGLFLFQGYQLWAF